jgi:hypothetical protein
MVSVVLATIAPLALYMMLKNNKRGPSFRKEKKAALLGSLGLKGLTGGSASKQAFSLGQNLAINMVSQADLVPTVAAARQPFHSRQRRFKRRHRDLKMPGNLFTSGTFTNDLGQTFRVRENVLPPPTRNYKLGPSRLEVAGLENNRGGVEPHRRREVENKYIELPRSKKNKVIEEALQSVNEQVSRNLNQLQPPGSNIMTQAGGASGFKGNVNMMRAIPHLPPTQRNTESRRAANIGVRGTSSKMNPLFRPNTNKQMQMSNRMSSVSRSKFGSGHLDSTVRNSKRKDYGDTYYKTVTGMSRTRVAPAMANYDYKLRPTRRNMRSNRI